MRQLLHGCFKTTCAVRAAAIVGLGNQALLLIDDVPFALQPQIPYLTCFSLHRLLERQRICSLRNEKPALLVRRRLTRYGHFHSLVIKLLSDIV